MENDLMAFLQAGDDAGGAAIPFSNIHDFGPGATSFGYEDGPVASLPEQCPERY
jgi:hypothetical protein